MFSGFFYTQFTDTFQEANDLLFADRTPKLPLDKIAKATCNKKNVQQGKIIFSMASPCRLVSSPQRGAH